MRALIHPSSTSRSKPKPVSKGKAMVSPETIAQVQEPRASWRRNIWRSFGKILRLKANEGEPDYSHHFTPEALARTELASSQKIATDGTDT
jgi:hypothetical protein